MCKKKFKTKKKVQNKFTQSKQKKTKNKNMIDYFVCLFWTFLMCKKKFKKKKKKKKEKKKTTISI